MGWTFTHKNSNEKPADFLARELLRWSLPEDQHPREVARCVAGSVVHFAVRFPAGYVADHADMAKTFVPEDDGSIVLAFVILTQRARDDYNFGWKDMDECSGPSEARASKAFIGKLSKIRDGAETYARSWRERCLANAETGSKRKAIKQGTIVRLPEPLKFTDGSELSEFKAITVPGRRAGKTTQRLVFQSLKTGGLYRLSARHLALAEIAA